MIIYINLNFHIFFKYFDKNFINGAILYKQIWNYLIISNNLNNDIIFFMNNIVERYNNIIIRKFVGFCKTICNYKNPILDKIYEMKNPYIDKKLSITRI